MAAQQQKQKTFIRSRVAQRVFETLEGLGVSDRDLGERITSEVIRRWDVRSDQTPLPGLEGIVSPPQQPPSPADIRAVVREYMGDPSTRSGQAPSTRLSERSIVPTRRDADADRVSGVSAHGESFNSAQDRPVEPRLRVVESLPRDAEAVRQAQGERRQARAKAAPKEKRVSLPPSGPTDDGNLGLSKNAVTVLEKRYLRRDEQGRVIERPADMLRRVAANIAAAEAIFDPNADVKRWEDEFYQVMASLDFLPNSPTLANAGRQLQQLSACFVLPIDDSMESIFDAVKYTALIHKSGGGTGFSFSRLRPEGDFVGSTSGVASGPVSFMRAFDTATEVTKQGGVRRGANMGILRVDHPDIIKFITSKEDNKSLSNFNISVAVTEEFMSRLGGTDGEDYDLVNPRTKKLAGKLNTKQIFDLIVDMAWRTGDPGVVFLDRINAANPTPHLGEIESTNPCGEQPLLPFESCNLGSINLSRMLKKDGNGNLVVDWDKLARTVRTAVRFLDDVIEVNRYPLEQIERMTKGNRKIGLGVMGFSDMLILMGIPYDSEEGLAVGEQVMRAISQQATEASVELAVERGVFPKFEGSIYDRPGMPRVRNATRTTIAPTGTLSIIADCSSGVEPLFALVFTRNILDGAQLLEVNPYLEEVAREGGFYSEELMQALAAGKCLQDMEDVPAEVKRVFVTAHDITPEWHVRMQAAFQRYTDNAVSKTVNFRHDATREDIARTYRLAYKEGCKGITIFRDRSKGMQVLSTGGPEADADVALQAEAPQHAADGNGRQDEAVAPRTSPRDRPKRTQGITEKVATGCGNLYVTVTRDEQGLAEVFSALGKAGGCAAGQLEAISRLISLSLRSGVEPASIVQQLKGIRCPQIVWEDGHAILSCADAIASVLEKEVATATVGAPRPIGAPLSPATHHPSAPKNNSGPSGDLGQCPECSSLLAYQEGCLICHACGYTKCS